MAGYPLEKGLEPTPVFLHEESHRQRSLVGYSSWGHKQSNTTEVSYQACKLKVVRSFLLTGVRGNTFEESMW